MSARSARPLPFAVLVLAAAFAPAALAQNPSWSVSVAATTLSEPEVISDPNGGGVTRWYVESGDDQKIHKILPDGTLDPAGWTPPPLNGVAQGQIVAGDITGHGAFYAYVSTHSITGDGYLYRQDMINPLGTIARHVVGPNTSNADWKCADAGGGWLQAGPRVILTRFGGPVDAVIVGTHCASGTNAILMYDALTLAPIATYAPGNLGVMNGSGIIVYPDLYFQPMRRSAGGAPSYVALQITAGGFGTATQGPDIGDIDADARLLVRTGSTPFVLFGNLAGDVYVIDPADPTNVSRHTSLVPAAAAASTTPVRGVGATVTAVAGDGSWSSYIVWTTDALVHSVLLTQAGFDSSSYNNTAITNPSSPTVLSGSDLPFSSHAAAFVGDGSGVLWELDPAALGTGRLSTPVASGTLGDPVFDYNARTNQGIVVGSDDGTVHRVPLPLP